MDPTRLLWRVSLPHSYIDFFGGKLVRFVLTIRGLGAFTLITLGIIFKKFRLARDVIRPLVLMEVVRSGLALMPMVLFLAAAVGLVVIGQTVSLLTRVGAYSFLGKVMVTVVVRELGPLMATMVVLARVGMANVIELGTSRALGEVEALEVLGIDPVHYLVVPRVIGMTVGVFALTVYLVLGALISGYLWAFVQDVPLRPEDYFLQLATSLRSLDFVLLFLKTGIFGILVAMVTCYHGLAQPLRLEQIPRAAIRAFAQSVIFCVLVDAFFIILYLVA